MIWHNYQLDDTVQKVREATTLWKAEKGIIEISKDTLVVLIKANDHKIGCVFHGDGKLILDTIIETNEGAIGKPIEKEIEKPFIMIGNIEQVLKNLIVANRQDLAKKGYVEEREFIERAEDLCKRLLGESTKVHGCDTFEQGVIFAFTSGEISGLDMLITKNSKIVYKTRNMTFISNKNKIVLKIPGKTVVSNDGKSIFLNA